MVDKLAAYLKTKNLAESSGHDWWHLFRVWKNAIAIQKSEGGNLLVIELAALLHDEDDWKFTKSANELLNASKLMCQFEVDKNTQQKVLELIKQVSFKGANVDTSTKNIEAAIVQDADRLDAIGAIGIARAFAFGGHFNREIYNPEIEPIQHNNFAEYQKSKSHTINHFYEKLLLLKDRMQTNTGKLIAQQRHQYMQSFLQQFYMEWNGEIKYPEANP